MQSKDKHIQNQLKVVEMSTMYSFKNTGTHGYSVDRKHKIAKNN